MEGAHILWRHWGGSHSHKPPQSLSLQPKPWLQKCLRMTLLEIRSWGQSHEEGGTKLLTWQAEIGVLEIGKHPSDLTAKGWGKKKCRNGSRKAKRKNKATGG